MLAGFSALPEVRVRISYCAASRSTWSESSAVMGISAPQVSISRSDQLPFRRMAPAGALVFRLKRQHLVRGIKVENALAGIANHGLLAGADVVIGLRPQHNLTGHAFVVEHLGDTAAAKLGNTLIVPQEILIDAGPHLIPFGAPLGKLLLVLGSALAGFNLLFFDFGGFGFQFSLGSFYFFVARVRVDH